MRKRWARAVWSLVVLGAALALTAPGASAATPGDNFAAALPLSSPLPIEVGGSNVGATKEIGENVSVFAGGHSVWFRWTADSTGWVTVGACSASFPTVVGVFTGTELANLTRVVEGNAAEGPHCPSQQREYTFRATAGTEYSIAVDGNALYLPPAPQPVTEGTFALRIEATPPPANDDFASAAPVSGPISEEPNGARFYFAGVKGYNWGATKQAGEPDHGGDPGGASVWFSWTAPESGTAAFGTFGAVSGVGASIVAVYTGSSLGSLVPIASNRSSGSALATVTAGTTYMIAVDGRRDPMSGVTPAFGFQLQVSMRLASGPGQPKQDSQPQATPPSSAPVPAPPRTILVKRSVDPDRRSVTLVFRASTAGAKYRCKLDRGRYKPCRSPKTYRHLADGRHSVRVVAVAANGLADKTPIIARLTIPKR